MDRRPDFGFKNGKIPPQMAVIRRALDSSRLAIWLSGEVTDKSTSDPGSGLQVSNVSV